MSQPARRIEDSAPAAEPGAAPEPASDAAPARESKLGALFRLDLVMSILAIASLVILGWVEYRGLAWPDPEFRTLALVDLGIVVAFALEFVVRFAHAENRRRFVRENWFDLVGLIPLYAEALSWTRAARLVRVIRLVRLLRAIQALRRFSASLTFARRVFVESRLGWTLSLAAAVVVAMALVVWLLERDTNEHLARFSDALWWSVVTATTVGYGDITPQSGAARVAAVGLMLLGIGLIGVVASSLSAAVVSLLRKDGGSAEASLAGELERVAVLHERGRLTDDEFAAAKRKLLS